jgi:hypothetical protein
MAYTPNVENISKINKVFEKWGVPDHLQSEYIKQALIALCQKEITHFVSTDGGHYKVGPKNALVALKILTPWEF